MNPQVLHTKIEEKKILDILKTVCDPEIPVLSILDMGIVREIKTNEQGIEIIITPTYSGCPAMDLISFNIKLALIEAGYNNVTVTSILHPAWTTDWMTETGKKKMKEFGIAPPNSKQQVCSQELFAPNENVQCPRCNSWNTALKSQFGSTACKALYQCNDCKEPFDYFKCH